MLSTIITWTTARRIQLSLMILAIAATLAIGAVGPVMAEVNGCQELLINGNMEGNDGWNVQTNGTYDLYSNYQARSGQRAAYLAGVNDATDVMRQTVSLPANQQTTLRFWWLVNSEESSNGWDGLNIQIASADGTPQRVLFTASDRNTGISWQQVTLDLNEFAGQTIQLQLEARTDASLSTDFFVDDMTLTTCDLSAGGTFFLPILRR